MCLVDNYIIDGLTVDDLKNIQQGKKGIQHGLKLLKKKIHNFDNFDSSTMWWIVMTILERQQKEISKLTKMGETYE